MLKFKLEKFTKANSQAGVEAAQANLQAAKDNLKSAQADLHAAQARDQVSAQVEPNAQLEASNEESNSVCEAKDNGNDSLKDSSSMYQSSVSDVEQVDHHA